MTLALNICTALSCLLVTMLKSALCLTFCYEDRKMDRYYTQKQVSAPSQLPPLRTRREPGMTGENRRRTAIAAAEDQTEMQIIHASIQLLSVKTRGQTETLFLLQHSCLPVRQKDRDSISASTQLPSCKAKRQRLYFCFNTAAFL